MADEARLTAEELNAIEFTKAMRGYTMHEVDTFLDQAVQELARLQAKRNGEYAPSTPRLTPLAIEHKVFNKAMRGYAMHEVDALLDRLAEELTRLHREERWIASSMIGRPSAVPGLTPEEIQRKQFTIAMRGYTMSEVDAFLNEAARELTRLRAERGHGFRPTPHRLTADNLRSWRFSRAMRGYVIQEVDQFLDRLSDEVTRLLRDSTP
ncbi:MAG TPA: DivIVA domain-containing protein [Actinomycetes bacterium]|nr:DivIVA domain-containing protein [Actinomycetes bacterium]